jgi:hypothetical protein
VIDRIIYHKGEHQRCIKSGSQKRYQMGRSEKEEKER